MENTIRKDKSNKKKRGSSTIGSTFSTFFSGYGKLEQIFEEGVPVKYMPKVLFVSGLLILYIMNSYLIEKKRIRIQKVKAEIEDLRTDYTTMKADYMYKSKQSEVVKRVESMGLKESSAPPTHIVVKEED